MDRRAKATSKAAKPAVERLGLVMPSTLLSRWVPILREAQRAIGNDPELWSYVGALMLAEGISLDCRSCDDHDCVACHEICRREANDLLTHAFRVAELNLCNTGGQA